jgi:eukaryotic-like serine/threonine-protein kinase
MTAYLSPGQVIDGKYRIERVLGEGGMGVVYEAHHLRLDQRVAVKCLLPALVSETTLVARFEREARASARLKSRHVVKILDVGNEAATGAPYMVMELLVGHDLDAEARSLGGRIPPHMMIEWLIQAAGALEEAHAAGIVHRDIKPSNLFLHQDSGERILKVLDFGIAKAAGIMPGITYAGATAGIAGTPYYMSPEQITAGEVDGRADIWSLGVVAYEMLSGDVPFTAEVFTALAVMIVNETPVPLMERAPNVHPQLANIIGGAMRKRAANRIPSMKVLAEALASIDANAISLPATRMSLSSLSGVNHGASTSGAYPSMHSAPLILQPGSPPSAPLPSGKLPIHAVTATNASLSMLPKPRGRKIGLWAGGALAVSAIVIGSLTVGQRIRKTPVQAEAPRAPIVHSVEAPAVSTIPSAVSAPNPSLAPTAVTLVATASAATTTKPVFKPGVKVIAGVKTAPLTPLPAPTAPPKAPVL